MYAFKFLFITGSLLTVLATQSDAQSSARDYRGPAAVVSPVTEPPAVLIVDPPLIEPLKSGRVVIQYRTENLRIVPVYGQAAVQVSPRLGHLHVTVDGAPWHWADASNEPIIIVGMTPGPHSILIELADPIHKTILRKPVSFVVPEIKDTHSSHH